MNILLADDDSGIRLYLKKFLEKEGHTVTVCENGSQAWEYYLEENYPLAILDWNMPGFTGPELCERIKSTGDRLFTFCILLTSHGEDEDIIEGLNRGADDYVTKPVVAAELGARLKSAIRIINYEETARAKEKKIRFSCFRSLTSLAERRDHETAEHMERIGVYCELIAREMMLPEQTCNDIRVFAPMHDIGKVGIPDGILHAPRNLSTPEREVIMLHTTIGWQILSGKPEFDMAASIAYTHHEQWDGGGYPRHLTGEMIPLEGRIAAIADCYDSLRTARSYSMAYSHDEVVAFIKEQSGQKFDPAVVEAFLGVHEEIRKIFDDTNNVLINTVP